MNKADMIEKDDEFSFLDKMIKDTPLKTRLKVSNEMAFISLLTELGYRENKAWLESENEILSKLCKAALTHTEHQLEQIEEFKKDIAGRTVGIERERELEEIIEDQFWVINKNHSDETIQSLWEQFKKEKAL